MNILIDQYYTWLKDNTFSKEIGDFFEITTPFLDRHNDCIQLYVKEINKDLFLLTDDGYTLDDLEMSGFSFNTPKRKEHLQHLLLSYGLKLNNNEITTTSTLKDFAYKKHFFIQAIISINDLFVTNRNNVTSLFTEDVAEFLEVNDIRYVQDAKLTGKSGLPVAFEFIIPKSKKMSERYLKIINSPNKQNTESTLFAWEDIKNVRGNSLMLVMINDTVSSVSQDILSAYKNYNVEPIVWTQRENHLNILTA